MQLNLYAPWDTPNLIYDYTKSMVVCNEYENMNDTQSNIPYNNRIYLIIAIMDFIQQIVNSKCGQLYNCIIVITI